MKSKDWTTVTIRMLKTDEEKLTRLAKKARRSRSAIARNFLLSGMDDAMLLDAIGLWKLMAALEDKYQPEEGENLVGQTA